MMHKSWSGIEEVPYSFSRSSVKFQGHTALKIVEFDLNWVFPDSNSSLNTPMAPKWCIKLEIEIEYTNGYVMMHKAWSSVEEVPYCFSRSSMKFQVHTALKIVEFDPNWAIPDSYWSFNTPMAPKMMRKAWSRIKEVSYCFSMSYVKLQGHTAKKIEFDPDWSFPDCNSSFNTPMDTKWCTKLRVA